MRSIHSVSYIFFVLFGILSSKKPAGCNPITNSNLNDHIRDFSLKDDNINSTRIKTLQKEESGRYANFAPVRNPVRFKDTPDNALSSSSYSRGLQYEHPGFAIHDYEDNPPIGYGYEYHIQDSDHGHHSFEHHPVDHYHGHHGSHHHVDYHHKHYDHALAAKTILWPIAGIALLGAAAALVSNPILLQLGVVSGRRKRRDTEENFDPEPDAELTWIKKKDELVEEPNTNKRLPKNERPKLSDEINFSYKQLDHIGYLRHRISGKKHKVFFKKVLPTVQSTVKDISMHTPRRYSGNEELHGNMLIPVPLIVKDNT